MAMGSYDIGYKLSCNQRNSPKISLEDFQSELCMFEDLIQEAKRDNGYKGKMNAKLYELYLLLVNHADEFKEYGIDRNYLMEKCLTIS